ncbi:class I glutamine amidotransferase-like protein [Periconia macrospinosa]|uniref:Class I glutamine amidotransferase-like protein n=1 Tax=Periconia macrospinosa TaxID=97972 RepID=A0A2V1CYC6_9PLEO|nr:class I glutamine amidotransferase-like protein [Periconia macrospinosa]
MRAKDFIAVLAVAAFANAQKPLPPMPPLANKTAVPLHFGFVIFPSLTPLDMFGPMEFLIGLSIHYGNVTGKMHMSILGAENTPSTCAPPNSQFGMGLSPTITFDEYRALEAGKFSYGKGAEKGPLDVIIVPGGGGTRGNVSREIAFVKEIYPSLKYIISVCTGSTILARAGVLDNKRATTNKRAWPWATTFGNNVTYQTGRWVKDGNTYSTSGVSAGGDGTLGFFADVYGEEVSQYVADSAEWTRWTNASYDPFAERWGVVTGR